MFFLILAVAMMGAEIGELIHQSHGANAAASPVVAVAPTVADVDRPVPAQSWDQENLKRNDRGCPSSIYIAPAGVLEECQ